MDTTHKGIDYGLGKTNVDTKNGIRYGVINQNEVLQTWADSSEVIYPCEDCPLSQGSDDCSSAECEPIGFAIDGQYRAGCGEDGDIFITKSPYYTRAQFCSPCAPGACYLTNPCEDGEKAYCFGHDWFWDSETKKAPYPVYRVSDDTLIN